MLPYFSEEVRILAYPTRRRGSRRFGWLVGWLD